MLEEPVVVIGGGVAGLTAAALLAHKGIQVTLLESHHQVGGCAGTFQRGPYVFDVGATQVAGFEPGGIHSRIFNFLNLPLPNAEVLDPACLVDLGDGSELIRLWYDPKQWKEEQELHFPGAQSFWKLCAGLHKSNWGFVSRDPVLPVRDSWDFVQLLQALRIENLPSALFSRLSVGDLMSLAGCAQDDRLRRFLDLQLRLYSQEPANRTAALYGATVLQMAQAPLGLWHLEGSMQVLSELLLESFKRDGGELLLNHRVVSLDIMSKGFDWELNVIRFRRNAVTINARDVVFSLPPQCLLSLAPQHLLRKYPAYFNCLLELPCPSGALVLYGAVERHSLPQLSSSHIQLSNEDLGSIFISISRDGDGRAPIGYATITASIFTKVSEWSELSESDYQARKKDSLFAIRGAVECWLGIPSDHWLHQELATPKSFAKWTGRPKGIVGGLGQTPNNFGPFGLASRSPIDGLWLCGDSIHPGEGTAGVSQSALMAIRQLLAKRGSQLSFP
ncbi:C-3',4' desaturase CrtD [Prochlorococcus sp. MIT 1300]|uniref:C-3',4' desaturase CrtD n=1 Tax=Prochlorococcus sp. MIT 1300 TaxID=3096218 RepID=UPI002A75F45F|nr:C-3',4' desaturase CrtD [Prochlorococcus sp. MIT 1300]